MPGLEVRIKEARTFVGLTQPALARDIGVSPRTLATYEKDASSMSVTVLQKIALSCGVDQIWLLTGQGQMNAPHSPKDLSAQNIEKELQNLFKKFKNPDQGQRIIQKVIILQEINPKLLEQIERYLTTTYETAQTMMGNQDWDELELSLQQNPEPVAEEENQKKDTGSN